MIKYKYLIMFVFTLCTQYVFADWTILVYMASDNGLARYAEQDIIEMEQSLLGEDSDIIVQVDWGNEYQYSGAYRYKIGYHPDDGIQSRLLADLGEIDSGSYQTLQDFVRWGSSRYKADNLALIIWSHGNGWSKEVLGKGIAPDNSTGSFISMSEHEMQLALAGINLDLLIYDACNMQTIENLVELEGHVDYIVGSEESVPVTGLPYISLFDYWKASDSVEELAKEIPNLYINAYLPGSLYNPGSNLRKVTLSTVKMANLPIFESSLNSYFQRWQVELESFRRGRSKLTDFGISYTDVDLKELFQEMSEFSENSNFVADNIILLEELFEVVISHNSSSFNYQVGTASIWFPKYSYQFSNNWAVYRNLNFAQGSIGSFLNRFLAPDEIPPYPFRIIESKVINETIFITWENHLDPDPLTYYLNINYDDGSHQVIMINNKGFYQGRVEQSGEFYIVAEDASGNSTRGETVKFEVSKDYGEVYIAPNPINNQNYGNLIMFDPSFAGKEAEIMIFSISGKKISQSKLQLEDDVNEHRIPFPFLTNKTLASGLYVCLVKIDGSSYRSKFAIEN